jgi:hypothetical protein
LRRPVTVSRDIRSLGRMNDDRTDLEVFQQCRDRVSRFTKCTAARNPKMQVAGRCLLP